MADAVNAHLEVEPDEILEKKQYEVAMISEMYHTSSLYHDDVIDNAEIRYNGAKIFKKSNLNYRIVASTNTCYYSENQIFYSLE